MEVDSVSGTISGEADPVWGLHSMATAVPNVMRFRRSAAAARPRIRRSNLPPWMVLRIPFPHLSRARPGAGGPIHPQLRRFARWRGAWFVHDRGRTDAEGCDLKQPNFAAQLANNNVIFRIPTPTFGLGLVEATPDSTLQANLAANGRIKSQLGISGALNTSGNDGTVTRFGWKAQNKSLMVFAGEAYNVEQGVSNEAFDNERAAVAGCVYNGSPEDATNDARRQRQHHGDGGPDVIGPGELRRFHASLRAAPPAPMSASATNGASLFNSVGCALCHTSTLTTGKSKFAGMSSITYHPYSDFALHHMGSQLSDGVSQGAAGADQFRTAPLWGVGQRLFFLHDGRTSDLLQAIQDHASSDCGGGGRRSRSAGSSPVKTVAQKPTMWSADLIRLTAHRCRMC